MIRTVIAFGALAALSAAAVPASAEGIRVHLAGKTPAAAYAEISHAAGKVCRSGISDRLYALQVERACQAATIADTVAKIGDPALLQYARSVNYTKLASN